MEDFEANPYGNAPTIDEGEESTQPANDAPTAGAPPIDSAEETAAKESADVKIEDEVAAGEKVSDVAPAELTDEERQTMETEAAKRLADPNSPKWFKNVVSKVYEPKLQKAMDDLKAYDPIKTYGDVERIKSDLETLRGLEATRTNPETGLPEPTTEPFVRRLAETQPTKVYQLMNDIARLPMPDNPQMTMLDGVLKAAGFDPARMADYKRFADNGYQLGSGADAPDESELQVIDPELREAYQSLSKAARDRIYPYDGETAEDAACRQEVLESQRYKLDSERVAAQTADTKATADKQAEQEARQQFISSWGAETDAELIKSDERITASFYESLVKPEVGFDDTQALGLALAAQTVINQGDSPLGKQALAVLEKQGVTLDPKLGELFEQRNAEARNLVFYQKRGMTDEYNSSLKSYQAHEAEINHQSSRILAALTLKNAENNKARAERRNSVLDAAQTLNTGISRETGVPNTIGTGRTELTPAQREQVLANPYGD